MSEIIEAWAISQGWERYPHWNIMWTKKSIGYLYGAQYIKELFGETLKKL